MAGCDFSFGVFGVDLLAEAIDVTGKDFVTAQPFIGGGNFLEP
jgi:hypothetical protein